MDGSTPLRTIPTLGKADFPSPADRSRDALDALYAYLRSPTDKAAQSRLVRAIDLAPRPPRGTFRVVHEDMRERAAFIDPREKSDG